MVLIQQYGIQTYSKNDNNIKQDYKPLKYSKKVTGG